jgi:hypothetical protein
MQLPVPPVVLQWAACIEKTCLGKGPADGTVERTDKVSTSGGRGEEIIKHP